MIKFITLETRPAKGDIVTGKVIKEGYRRGFVVTDHVAKISATHIIDSKHVREGFYVIGHTVN